MYLLHIGGEKDVHTEVFAASAGPSDRTRIRVRAEASTLGIHQRGVQSEGGAVDGGSTI